MKIVRHNLKFHVVDMFTVPNAQKNFHRNSLHYVATPNFIDSIFIVIKQKGKSRFISCTNVAVSKVIFFRGQCISVDPTSEICTAAMCVLFLRN